MESILINIIQHEQCYLVILFIGPKSVTLSKKDSGTKCFPVNVGKFLGTTFFTEHVRATAFGFSFVNP